MSTPILNADDSIGDPTIDVASLRTRPVQQRSAQRVTLLLDAAAAIIDEKGFDGLTTTDVASRSDSSVGVVYRYYPNIQSLLLALAARNLERFMARATEVLAEVPPSWLAGLDPVIDVSIHMMRNEPGFRALRFGTIIDQRVIGSQSTTNAELARRFSESSVERYGVADTEALRLDIEVAVEVSEALIQRAFANDPQGDERFIAKARSIMRDILAVHAALA